jgi:anti-sigma-K factor RskA
MNGHPTRPEDFDLYALGVLEGEEKAAIESHVPTCAECAKKLAEARGRIALLAFSAPRVEPSPAVRERLMRQVHASAEIAGAKRVQPELERTGGFFGRWWAAVLVPACILLLFVAAHLRNENERLSRELAQEQATLQQQQLASERQQKQLDEARHVANLVEAKDTVIVPLAQQKGMPQGTAHVMYNARMGMMMYEGKLEPSPAGKSYQLWLVPTSGAPISAGVFNPTTGETTHTMMKVPQGVTAKAFAITLEPAGGKPQPTGPFVLMGAVS